MIPTENRPPRIIIKPMLAKKPSRIVLRDAKVSPKPPEKSNSACNVVRTPTRTTSTVKAKSPVRSTITSATIRRADHASPPPKKEMSAIEGREAREKACEEAYSNPNAHSHPTLRKQNPLLGHPFPSISSRSNAADTPPIPPKDPRRLNVSIEDTDADDEDSDHTAGKYACQFTSPVSPNKAQTPSSVKSVRWDPAIISYGRVTSSRRLPSNSTSPPTPSPRPRDNFGDALRTLRKLDKQDQQILCKLLQQMDASNTDDEWIEPLPRQKEEKHSELHIETNVLSSKKLNPKAPAFQDFSRLEQLAEEPKEYSKEENNSPSSTNKTYIPSPATISTPPNIPKGKKDLKEPTWVNIFNPPAPKDMPKGIPKLSQPLQGFAPFNTPNIGQATFPLSSVPLSMPAISGFPDVTQTIWVPMQIMQSPFGFQAFPQIQQPGLLFNPQFLPNAVPPKRESLNARRPPFKPRANKGPLVDISANFIPPEDGTCREAQPIPWSQSLLDSFAAKYPQTGQTNSKARRQAPGHMRQAAAIQQQLELLIYQEKEKNAMDEKMGIKKPQPTKKESNEISKESFADPFSSVETSAKNSDQ